MTSTNTAADDTVKTDEENTVTPEVVENEQNVEDNTQESAQ